MTTVLTLCLIGVSVVPWLNHFNQRNCRSGEWVESVVRSTRLYSITIGLLLLIALSIHVLKSMILLKCCCVVDRIESDTHHRREGSAEEHSFSRMSALAEEHFKVLLLFIGGVESNPGPMRNKSTTLRMGLANARSVVNKAALIHDVINDNRLDLLAVTETWVYKDSPEVHKREAAPPGFSIVHAHRDTSTRGSKKGHGGGIALQL